MPDLVPIRRALLSVSDKTDLVPFANGLKALGVEIISTGGTARALREANVQVIEVEQITGMPEMMDGRVKTLHPTIHGGLLADRDNSAHVQALREHNIEPIDLVCINLYPFEQTVAAPDVSPAQCIEQIDIGGPAMLRSAAKNHAFITVVTASLQYDFIMNELHEHDGATTLALRRELAAAAFTRTAEYDTAISAWMSRTQQPQFPYTLQLNYAHVRDLRYGENPHQQAALYSDPANREPSVVDAEVLHGKELSYNNILDASCAMEIVRDLQRIKSSQTSAAIIKHNNPCGAAVGEYLADVVARAYKGDPLAAFGGILAVGTRLDRQAAEAIVEGEKFLEVVIAPGFDDVALETLSARWKNVRLLAVPTMHEHVGRSLDYRSMPGGMLIQQRDSADASPQHWHHAAGPAPDALLVDNAAFVWMVCKHLRSNAIAIGENGQLLGAGAGQVDRVGACRLAVSKAGDRLVDATRPAAASDGFFPFADGPQHLIDAGVTCIVQPGGSKRDEQTINLCEQRGVTLLLTNIRHFRH